MTRVFSASPMRWSASKLVRGLFFPFLLLLPLAQMIPAQQPMKTESGPTPTAAQTNSLPVIAPTQPASPLRLQSGDLVEVAVYNVPELTTKARVSTKGEIYLPLIDYVRIAGSTAEEAEGV